MKDQKVDFSFAYTLEDEEGKQTKNTLRETFRYAVDALNLMTVTAGGEKRICRNRKRRRNASGIRPWTDAGSIGRGG